MSANHLISDMLTRIRNGQMAKLASVKCPSSKLLVNVAEVLKNEGFIREYEVHELGGNKKEVEVHLKYYAGEGVIQEIKTISKPGRRVYSSVKDLPKFRGGLGAYVLSTSKGVLSDYEARNMGVGGELLFCVF